MATSAPTLLTAPQIAAMDAGQRQAYFNELPAEARQQQMAAYRAFQNRMNQSYMKNTVTKMAVCPQASGGGFSQVYSAGATLPFTVPSSQNAFLQGFWLRMNIVYTLATGTSAVYALNAAAPWSLIDNIVLQYNGTQLRFKPYIMRTYARLTGDSAMTWPNAVLAGQSNADLNSYLSTNLVTTAGSQQTATLEMYIPLNALHPQDVRGLLPVMGGETAAQVVVTCAPQAIGPDPILNTWSAVSGSAHSVSFANTSTVQIYSVYRDGTSMRGPALLGCDLSGLGTVQYAIDVPLTGLTANNILSQKLSIMDQLHYVILTVVDGNQSTSFTANTNFAVIQLSKDAVGSNIFWKFGTGTNLSTEEFFNTKVRQVIKQDLDPGILPLAYSPIDNQAAPSDQEGTHFLNTGLNGWPDVHYSIQLNTVGSVSGITPRVECHVIFNNSAGLQSA